MTDGFVKLPHSFTRETVPELQLDAYDIAVIVALAARSNKAGVCWPSMKTIALESGSSRARVAKSIARLVECGLLEIKSAGRGSSHRYRVLLNPGEGAPETSTKRHAPRASTKRDAPEESTKRSAPERSAKTYSSSQEQGCSPQGQLPAPEERTKQIQGSRPNKGLRPGSDDHAQSTAPATRKSAPLPQSPERGLQRHLSRGRP